MGAELGGEEEEDNPEGVPTVSLDYFFLGDSRKEKMKESVKDLTTKELGKKIKIAQIPANGSRLELERKFNEFRKKTLAEAGRSSSEDEEESASPEDEATHPATVMLDHQCEIGT